VDDLVVNFPETVRTVGVDVLRSVYEIATRPAAV